VVAKLFDEIAPKYADRTSGYTRIVRIGQRRGDAAEAVALGRRSVRLLGLIVGPLSAALILLARPLAGWFVESPEVADLAAQVIRWFAVAQFFSALSIATQGALLGAGDTLPALRYTFFSEWCLLLPLSGLLVAVGWVPVGLLAAWVLAPVVTLALMQRRFRSGRWKPPGATVRGCRGDSVPGK